MKKEDYISTHVEKKTVYALLKKSAEKLGQENKLTSTFSTSIEHTRDGVIIKLRKSLRKQSVEATPTSNHFFNTAPGELL